MDEREVFLEQDAALALQPEGIGRGYEERPAHETCHW